MLLWIHSIQDTNFLRWWCGLTLHEHNQHLQQQWWIVLLWHQNLLLLCYHQQQQVGSPLRFIKPFTCLRPLFLPSGGWMSRFCWPGSLCTLATLGTNANAHTSKLRRKKRRKNKNKIKTAPATFAPTLWPQQLFYSLTTQHTVCYDSYTTGDGGAGGRGLK